MGKIKLFLKVPTSNRFMNFICIKIYAVKKMY